MSLPSLFQPNSRVHQGGAPSGTPPSLKASPGKSSARQGSITEEGSLRTVDLLVLTRLNQLCLCEK